MKYSYKSIDNKIIVEDLKNFDLKQTFECGQCFRWDIDEDGSYTGIAYDRVINIKEERGVFIFDNTDLNDFERIWTKYFDLDRDYNEIIKTISHNDNILKTASEYGAGIRILNQDIWEIIVSFIISSNNNIPRIKKIINSICQKYGEEIIFKGKKYYTFPSPKVLCGEDLGFCKSGYRAAYITDAVKKILDNKISLFQISNLTTDEARNELMEINGVGPKVSDCILLFSLGRYEVFPVDVWIKRAVEILYFDKKITPDKVREFAKEKFGDLAGFAQQYLYYWSRESEEFKKIIKKVKKE